MDKKDEIRKAIDLLVSSLSYRTNWDINNKIEYAIQWLTHAIITDVDKDK